MKYTLYIFLVVLLFTSCGSKKEIASKDLNVKQELLDEKTFKIYLYSDDKTYGYTEKNPIMVGGVKTQEGPLNERRFLNALVGPNGEKISYYRIGSCCQFSTPNGMIDNGGLLDKYSVTYEGLDKEIILYINMYDSGKLKVPVGFKLKPNSQLIDIN